MKQLYALYVINIIIAIIDFGVILSALLEK